MSDQHYRVFKIENGTVIDHIVPTMALKIIDILGIRDKGLVSIGINFDSGKTGKKDIIKFENVYLDKTETDLIALFSPHATINIIKDNKVIEKRKIEMPSVINSIIKCPNPTCVTNNYRDCDTKFIVERFDENSTIVRCYYCEKETTVISELIK
ncbi:MAG: aspartate carbamoyltransferase regulatory subunit [Spirochaetes bacterium GWC1_27_15]|nr:MAG: aspartate carbamoyltransferase regulatory subunit [Spirochaetes bacterium GWB1_27_13]OHD22963.1 MAG: aspartate carbamoyltransferase regulatory subunit [Spirochaetes bacterium GWC1_27_15]